MTSLHHNCAQAIETIVYTLALIYGNNEPSTTFFPHTQNLDVEYLQPGSPIRRLDPADASYECASVGIALLVAGICEWGFKPSQQRVVVLLVASLKVGGLSSGLMRVFTNGQIGALKNLVLESLAYQPGKGFRRADDCFIERSPSSERCPRPTTTRAVRPAIGFE
jgi:hypothetical protein